MKFIHDDYEVRGYRFKDRTTYTTYHLGTDLKANYEPLYAPSDGKSIAAPYGNQGGQWLHFEEVGTAMCEYFGVTKLIHRFAHLSAYNALKNYKEGDEIATSGNTGTATTGAHTHWDLSKEKLDVYNIDNFIDPEEYHRVKFNLMYKPAPQWFKDEGFYDRAKSAGIQGVDKDQPQMYWELLATQFKILDNEQGANEVVPPTGNKPIGKRGELKIRIILPELTDEAQKDINAVEDWFSQKIPTTIDIVQKDLIPEWHFKTDSKRNMITADWLQKEVEPFRNDAQILCLVVRPENYKKKGTHGVAYDYAYAKNIGQVTYQLWKRGYTNTQYGGFAGNRQLPGTLRHEICHALFQLTGFDEIDKEKNNYLTHIYEKEKRFDELLDIIPFNKI